MIRDLAQAIKIDYQNEVELLDFVTSLLVNLASTKTHIHSITESVQQLISDNLPPSLISHQD